MILRTITVWTTSLLLIATAVISFGLPFFFLFEQSNVVPRAAFIWLLSGSPVAVSCFVAREIKFGIPAAVLLVPTIVYGWLYFWGVYAVISYPGNLGTIAFFLLGIWTLPVSIPTWIFALRLNSYYVRQAEDIEWQQRLFDDTAEKK